MKMSARSGKHEIRAAAAEVRRHCGGREMLACRPASPLPESFRIGPWAIAGRALAVALLGAVLGLTAFSLLASLAGCRFATPAGESIQAAGAAIAAVPHPIAIPIGAIVSGLGAIVAAIGKLTDKKPVTIAGAAALAGGIGVAGAELALPVSPAEVKPPAIVAPLEPGIPTGTARPQ